MVRQPGGGALYRGVQEENHYYPFGLTLQTDAEANVAEQPIKFQSQQHENDFGLNMYSFRYREHDPQIGRFWQIDPLAEKYTHNSTYAFSENRVTGHIELEGLEALDYRYTLNNAWRELKANFSNVAKTIDNLKVGDVKTISRPTGESTTATVEVKTSYGGNFSAILGYIMHHNTNEGNSTPWFSKKTEVKGSVGYKKDVNLGVASAAVSSTVDNDGVGTVTIGASGKTPSGINVGGEASVSTDNTSKFEANASVGAGGTSVKASATASFEKSKATGFELGIGVEQKAGGFQVSEKVYIGYGE